MPELYVGLMSGTSLDGIDAVLADPHAQQQSWDVEVGKPRRPEMPFFEPLPTGRARSTPPLMCMRRRSERLDAAKRLLFEGGHRAHHPGGAGQGSRHDAARIHRRSKGALPHLAAHRLE